VSITDGDPPTVKLIGIGTSAFLQDCDERYKPLTGSRLFLAPELCGPEKHVYDSKCDIWSCGILCFIALIGEHPYDISDTYTLAKTKDVIRQSSLAATLTAERYSDLLTLGARDFLLKMLQQEPKLRQTAAELLQHEWLNASQHCEKHLESTRTALTALLADKARHVHNINRESYDSTTPLSLTSPSAPK
jgi:serine/threonine protein kinase